MLILFLCQNRVFLGAEDYPASPVFHEDAASVLSLAKYVHMVVQIFDSKEIREHLPNPSLRQ